MSDQQEKEVPFTQVVRDMFNEFLPILIPIGIVNAAIFSPKVSMYAVFGAIFGIIGYSIGAFTIF